MLDKEILQGMPIGYMFLHGSEYVVVKTSDGILTFLYKYKKGIGVEDKQWTFNTSMHMYIQIYLPESKLIPSQKEKNEYIKYIKATHPSIWNNIKPNRGGYYKKLLKIKKEKVKHVSEFGVGKWIPDNDTIHKHKRR